MAKIQPCELVCVNTALTFQGLQLDESWSVVPEPRTLAPAAGNHTHTGAGKPIPVSPPFHP